MNPMTVPTAEVIPVTEAMTWVELAVLCAVVLLIVAAAVVAPLSRPRRNIVATDVLKHEGNRA